MQVGRCAGRQVCRQQVSLANLQTCKLANLQTCKPANLHPSIMQQDLLTLLNQPPGSLVYHLVTLFALQIIFGLSLGMWRRERQEREARRMIIAAAAIFILRLLLLLAVILFEGEGSAPILIALNQAGDSITAVLIVWAIIPHPPHLPRLGDTLMLIGLFVILIMSVYLAQLGGMDGVWTIFNLFVYGTGFIFLLINSSKRTSLRTTILLILLIAAAIGWIRLGYLVAFPLWAVMLYHESNRPVASYGGDIRDRLTAVLALSTAVIRPTERESVLHHAIYLVADLTHANFVGVVSTNAEEPNTLHVMSNQPQAEENEPRDWTLNLSDWPAFRQVLAKQEPIRLALAGRGARQVLGWYREMGLPVMGDLFIIPITAGEEKFGLLLLAGQPANAETDEKNEQLMTAMATYTAIALSNVKRMETAVVPLSPLEDEVPVASGYVITLEKERDDLEAYNHMMEGRLQQTEQRLTDSTQRVQELMATMTVMEKHKRSSRTVELEDEVATLREALLAAEEALAMVAASETEISMDWVMMTITRYSGQLEEAQMQIQSLQNELLAWERSAGNEAVLLLIRELRAPITAVIGYADLLMKGQAGAMTKKQREFLTHIQVSTERMGELLAQLVQTSADNRQLAEIPQGDLVVEDLIETAVDSIMPQIREKQLQFDCTITPGLPPLPTVYHMLTSALDGLLEYSCQQTPQRGQVAFLADVHKIEEDESTLQYLCLSISSNGSNISPDELLHLFDEHGAAPQLAMSRSLIEAKGGRLWAERDEANGLTFSALLPL